MATRWLPTCALLACAQAPAPRGEPPVTPPARQAASDASSDARADASADAAVDASVRAQIDRDGNDDPEDPGTGSVPASARFDKVGYLPPDPTPQAKLSGLIKSEIARWGKVIEGAGIARSQ